jgi:ATP-dependent Clp protease ATP-binding subunit ClpA
MTVFGQDTAVSQMVGAMKLARAGLRGWTETDRLLPASWADGRG